MIKRYGRAGSALYTNFENIWCLDSGATSRMCRDQTQSSSIESINNLRTEIAVDESTEALEKGTITDTLRKKLDKNYSIGYGKTVAS